MHKPSPIIHISSRIAKGVLLVGTILYALLFLFGAYSGYIAPMRWTAPAFLGLFFPLLLAGWILISLFWLLTLDVRRLLLVGAVWLISLPQLLTFFPISRSTKVLGTEGELLRVLSYNVSAFGFKPHSATQPNPILQYIRSSDADIVCLQEAMLNQNPEAGVVTKTLREYLASDYPYIACIQVGTGGSTLAILSKYPLSEVEQIPVPTHANGAIKAKVKLKGRELLLVNVHLESFHLKADDGANYIALAKQGEALQLKDALRAKLGPTFRYHNAQAVILHELIKAYNSPRVLVCGDFNDTPLSYTRRKIGDGLKDAFVARGNGFGFTFRNRPFIVRIDHILYGKAFRALSCEIDKTADESDHYPISAVLALDEAFYQD